MFNKKNIIYFAFLMLVVSLLAACGGDSSASSEGGSDSAGEKVQLRFAHFLPENTAPHQSVAYLAEQLNEKSDGRIEIDIYSEAVLGNESDIFQQLQEGSIDGAFISNSELSSHSEDFAAWSMPFLLPNYELAVELAGSDEALALFDNLDSIKGLGYVMAGMRYAIMVDEPYTELADIQNKALRHIPTPAITEWYGELGVSSVPIPSPEIYTSFQTGVIDAVDTELDLVFAYSLHEIGNYVTPLDQMLHGGILMNEQSWESLSDEDKQLMEEVMAATIEFNYELTNDREAESIQRAKDEFGLEFYEVEDIDVMHEKANEFHEKYASRSDLIRNFIDKAKEIAESQK